MAKPNFNLLTSLPTQDRRDFKLVDETILSPFAATALVDGEFLELAAGYKLQRGVGEGISPVVFPVHVEKGRYDTAALKMVTVIFSGQYEAETSLVDLTGLVVGDALTVQDVSGKRGLKKAGATAGRVVVGYVTRIMAGKVRFLHMSNHKMP